MKRLLLILAFYVLASVGAKAQVVGEEDSIKVLWEVDIEDEDGNIFAGIDTPIYLSSDKKFVYNTFYHAWSNGMVRKNQLQKRDIETGEVVQEAEAKSRGRFTGFYVFKNSDLLCYSKSHPTDIYFHTQTTLDSVDVISLDSNQIKEWDYKNPSKVVCMDVSPDEKYLAASYINEKYIIQRNVFVYNLETKEHIKLDTDGKYVVKLKYSSDGKYLVAVVSKKDVSPLTHEILIYNTADYSLRVAFDLGEKGMEISGYKFSAITFSNSGKYMMISHNGRDAENSNLYVYNMENLSKKTIKIPFKSGASSTSIMNNAEDKLIISNPNSIYDLNTEKSYLLPENINLGGEMFLDENNNKLLAHNSMYIAMYSFDINGIISDVNQENKEEIKQIYPNPTTNIVNIPINENTERIEIYDVRGEHVLSTSVPINRDTSAGGGQVRINISQLPVGTYFVKVYQGGSVVVHKFVKK
jgi:dipeptidyl aminopeptidase/acylaminoacyl peptidase